MDYFASLPKEIVTLIISGMDFVSYWKFCSTRKDLLGLITLSNDEWRKKYAKDYYLNDKELACYDFDDWSYMYRARIMNEKLFLQEIEEARNRMQPEQTDIPEQQDEEYPDDGPLDEYKERIAVMHKRGSHWEFKPEHNPYYTLLTTNNINEIKKALKIALYGFLIYEKKHSYRMIDVITTTLSKHVESHPDLAKHFAISDLGRCLYNSASILLRTLVPLGSISLLVEQLHPNSPFRETVLETLTYMTNDRRMGRIRKELKVIERAFDILRQRTSVVSDDSVLNCINLILSDVPREEHAAELQNILCEVLENWEDDFRNDHRDYDLHSITKNCFSDFKGNDPNLVNRLIAVILQREHVYQAYTALALCTTQSVSNINTLIAEEALHLVANNIQLVQKVVDTSSDQCLAWSDSLVLIQNILKTEIGRETLWNYKRLNDFYVTHTKMMSIAGEAAKATVFDILTKFNEIALSKPNQKNEVVSVVQSWNLSPLMRTMLKHARNKFWLSFLALDPPIKTEILTEFVSLLSSELKNGGMPLFTTNLLDTILQLRPDAFVGANLRAGADLEDLYATLYNIVIFGNEGRIDVTFRCEAMILFIRMLSLDKVLNKVIKDKELIDGAVQLCDDPDTPLHFKLLIFSFLGHLMTRSKSRTNNLNAAERAIEQFVTTTNPNSARSPIMTPIKPFEHLFAQKTSTRLTAMFGAWILAYFSSTELGREILRNELKDQSSEFEWLKNSNDDRTVQLFSQYKRNLN